MATSKFTVLNQAEAAGRPTPACEMAAITESITSAEQNAKTEFTAAVATMARSIILSRARLISRSRRPISRLPRSRERGREERDEGQDDRPAQQDLGPEGCHFCQRAWIMRRSSALKCSSRHTSICSDAAVIILATKTDLSGEIEKMYTAMADAPRATSGRRQGCRHQHQHQHVVRGDPVRHR